MSDENTTNETSPEVKTEVATETKTVDPNIAKEFSLSDGRKVIIYKGKGKHAQKAERNLIDSTKTGTPDPTIYTSSLMSMLVRIDGKELVPEEFGELDIKDFNKINTEFAELNF